MEEEEKERAKERSRMFRGTGFRLGDTEAPSDQVEGHASAKEPEKVKLQAVWTVLISPALF